MKYYTQINLLKTGLSAALMLAGSVLGPTAVVIGSMSAVANGQTSASVPYGEGAFEVGLTPISNKYCLVNVEGECGGQTVEVEVLLEDENADYIPDPGQPAIEGTAWENVVFAQGTMSMGGSLSVSGDTLHSNGALTQNGAAGTVGTDGNGHLTSSTSIHLNGNVDSSGSLTAPNVTVNGANNGGSTINDGTEVAPKAFPEYDLTSLYNTASANSQVINGDINTGSQLDYLNIPGGVVWINGDLRVRANANFDCTVIVTGTIQIMGDVNWNQSLSNTKIISRDSSIRISGNTEIEGLLYAAGDISMHGTTKLVGQIISGEDVTINGDVEVMDYLYSGPGSGAIDGGDPLAPSIQIGAWQK